MITMGTSLSINLLKLPTMSTKITIRGKESKAKNKVKQNRRKMYQSSIRIRIRGSQIANKKFKYPGTLNHEKSL